MTACFRVRTILFLVMCGPLALSGCGGATKEASSSEPRPAKLMTLSQASNQTSNSLPAVVRSVRTTELAFQVGGQIVEWNALDGEIFQQGDVIARLDSRSFEAAVAQAEAQFANAKSEYDRAVRLIEEDAISRSVVESREAQVQVAQASLDTARKNLSDTVLRAPFSGGVGRTYVEQFQNVGPQQPVLVLQSRAVDAVVNVPASLVLNSQRTRYFDTYVELDAAPDRRIEATFREALGQADSATQTFEAHFSFLPPSDLLVLTGMTATLYFTIEDIEQADESRGVAVPLASVMAEGDTRYVWVVKGADKVLERRNVTLAEGVGEMIVVTSGLDVGETIVEAGGAYLQAGDRVRPWRE